MTEFACASGRESHPNSPKQANLLSTEVFAVSVALGGLAVSAWVSSNWLQCFRTKEE